MIFKLPWSRGYTVIAAMTDGRATGDGDQLGAWVRHYGRLAPRPLRYIMPGSHGPRVHEWVTSCCGPAARATQVCGGRAAAVRRRHACGGRGWRGLYMEAAWMAHGGASRIAPSTAGSGWRGGGAGRGGAGRGAGGRAGSLANLTKNVRTSFNRRGGTTSDLAE